MLTENHASHNGFTNQYLNSNGHVTYLECASDHEPRPIIDVVPSKPRPGWETRLAPVTWSMSYIDGSGISHSVTLRGDTEQEVLDMVKPLVAGIRKAKAKAKEANPEQSETQPEKVVCKIHGVEMERRVSKRTGGHYHCHRLAGAGNDLCFGREKQA